MSEGNAGTVRQLHEAFDRQDIPGFLEHLDEGVQWEAPSSLPYGGSFTGREAVGGFFAQLPEHFEELAVTVHELIEAGDVVLDICTISGRGKSGGTVEADAAFVWRFSGGRPVSFKEYSDTARIREGLGQEAAATA